MTLKPSDELIESMCLRYDHSFGMPSNKQFMGIPINLTDRQKDSIRSTMRQLWEEVAGVGFYKGMDTISAYRDALESIATLKTRNIEAHLVARAALNHETYTAE